MRLLLAGLLSIPTALSAEPAPPELGTVESYVAAGLAEHPRIAADRHAVEAAAQRAPVARALPDPTVSVGGFLQPVETRVGPQQARVGLQQSIPWPSRLAHAGRAADSETDAAEWQVQAAARLVREQVEVAYWRLWGVRAERSLHQEHLVILEGLSATVRARVEVGAASLADLQQVDLSRSLLEDRIATLDADEVAAVAALRAAVGGEALGTAPTSSAPGLHAVDADATAPPHPQLQAMDAMTEAAHHRQRAAAARRLPDLTVGADWIATGPARMDDVEDSGKDAIAVMVGLRLPLRQGLYARDADAAAHAASALHARRQAGALDLEAAVDAAAVGLRDSARRARLTEGTLLPQAQAAYDALLGEYAAGRAQVAQILLGQRDLLELAVQHTRAVTEHQLHRARLTSLTGASP